MHHAFPLTMLSLMNLGRVIKTCTVIWQLFGALRQLHTNPKTLSHENMSLSSMS